MCSLVSAFALMTMAGCDWSTGGGVDGYNSRYNWVDFSGVYRGYNGGLLVTDYTATPGTPGVTNIVSSERVGTGNGSASAFSGVVNRKPVVPGTFSITAGGITLVDNGSGTLAGGGSSGSINYGTGAWSVQFAFPLDNGTAILASYQYSVSGSSGSGGAGPGSSGVSIYSFTVFQTGEDLRIVDNNGNEYLGYIGNTLVSEGNNSTAPVVGTTVVAQYEASGISKAGVSVNLVGTFQGVVQDSTGNQIALSERRMFGTWIEVDGKTGDINGEASPIIITADTGSTTPTVTP